MRLESAATGIDIEWKTTLPTDIPLSVYPFIIDHVRAMRTTAEDGWPLIEIPERHPHRDEVPRHDAVPMMTAVTFLEVAIAPAGTGLYTSN